jgi:hypothetical protein
MIVDKCLFVNNCMNYSNNENKHPVTPERAVEILAKHKVKVTLEQAEKIIEFMEEFAKLAIEQYVK